MAIYTLQSVERKYAQAVAWLGLMVLVFGLFVGPVLAGDAPAGAAMRIVVGTFFSLVVLAGAFNALIEPCEIQILDDGTVVVLGAARSTCLRARDILSLEGKYEVDYSNYVWCLVLQSNTRMFTFGQFPDVMHFVNRIRALNPDVDVRGLWPMGAR